MPKNPMFGGYIGTGGVRPETKQMAVPIYPPNTGFEVIITFIQHVTNILK